MSLGTFARIILWSRLLQFRGLCGRARPERWWGSGDVCHCVWTWGKDKRGFSNTYIFLLVPLLLTLSKSLVSTSVVVIRVLSPSVCFGRGELKRRERQRQRGAGTPPRLPTCCWRRWRWAWEMCTPVTCVSRLSAPTGCCCRRMPVWVRAMVQH